MLFVLLLGGVAAIAMALHHLRVPGLADWPSRMRVAMAFALAFAGADHLVTPGRYIPMIEGFIPHAPFVVLLTGLCELAGAAGLLLRRTRKTAAICLAVYFVCVFPANINNALNGLVVDGLPQAAWYYWARLAFQPAIVWWALVAGEVMRLPRKGSPAGGWPIEARLPDGGASGSR